jgi:hypothetical protein
LVFRQAGAGKFGPQMKYADRRRSPCVVIQGSDEFAKGPGAAEIKLGADAGLAQRRGGGRSLGDTILRRGIDRAIANRPCNPG